ncbi:hypothetical protein CWO91_13440 [Bradyrhizobium genosp. SA-3]|uniref:hypothetical protein n=1 Tax=Bradyrhizobium genosp. SA-3 TaxID=508868 RepID=UPI001029B886|nr:hypothetical protein [Bradyrhizobium genosp. SA-3]RZN10327.1 hypothetical protein CWO91_13440 [Bradyrhizobium genosp. SA-3]
MRYPIEIAPRNGSIVVLEDDATGTIEAAYWSPTGEWIGEFGQPSALNPSHWHPCYSFFQSSSRREAPQTPAAGEPMALRSAHARRGFVISCLALLVVTIMLAGTFVQQVLLQPYLEKERGRSAALGSAYATASRGPETTGIAMSHNTSADEAERAQALQAMERAPPTADERPAAKQSEDVAPENSKPVSKAVEVVPPNAWTANM